MTTSVVTYQHAYIPGTTSLCARHAESPYPGTPKLGPVSHGAHEGECDSCGIEAMLRGSVGKEARATVEAAGAAGGIDEVRRLAEHGWPANRPLDGDSPELRAAIQAEAARVVAEV